MEIAEHFDHIMKLGFDISIEWNDSFGIYYCANDVYPASAYSIEVLLCRHYSDKNYNFLVMLETCCDLFYDWYNKNLNKIKEFDTLYDVNSLGKLEDCCPGDVTIQVARDLNLTDLLKIIDKG